MKREKYPSKSEVEVLAQKIKNAYEYGSTWLEEDYLTYTWQNIADEDHIIQWNLSDDNHIFNCLDYSLVFIAAAVLRGWTTLMDNGWRNGGDHFWVLVEISHDKWLAVDPTFGDVGRTDMLKRKPDYNKNGKISQSYVNLASSKSGWAIREAQRINNLIEQYESAVQKFKFQYNFTEDGCRNWYKDNLSQWIEEAPNTPKRYFSIVESIILNDIAGNLVEAIDTKGFQVFIPNMNSTNKWLFCRWIGKYDWTRLGETKITNLSEKLCN